MMIRMSVLVVTPGCSGWPGGVAGWWEYWRCRLAWNVESTWEKTAAGSSLQILQIFYGGMDRCQRGGDFLQGRGGKPRRLNFFLFCIVILLVSRLNMSWKSFLSPHIFKVIFPINIINIIIISGTFTSNFIVTLLHIPEIWFCYEVQNYLPIQNHHHHNRHESSNIIKIITIKAPEVRFYEHQFCHKDLALATLHWSRASAELKDIQTLKKEQENNFTHQWKDLIVWVWYHL